MRINGHARQSACSWVSRKSFSPPEFLCCACGLVWVGGWVEGILPINKNLLLWRLNWTDRIGGWPFESWSNRLEWCRTGMFSNWREFMRRRYLTVERCTPQLHFSPLKNATLPPFSLRPSEEPIPACNLYSRHALMTTGEGQNNREICCVVY